MRGSSWSPEREQLLAQLCATERYARDIAKKLGVTRNAVIGKVGRMRSKGHPLEFKGTPGSPEGGPRRRHRKAKTNAVAAPPTPAPMPRSARDAHGLRLEPKLRMRRLSLMELEHCSCRWPIGEPGKPGFCFCGNDVGYPDRPYCTPHHAFAHHG